MLATFDSHMIRIRFIYNLHTIYVGVTYEMHVRNMSAHGSTRAKCIRSNGRIQIRSNTKDASTGRNTNTSFLVATDMHATETMNQQWGRINMHI